MKRIFLFARWLKILLLGQTFHYSKWNGLSPTSFFWKQFDPDWCHYLSLACSTVRLSSLCSRLNVELAVSSIPQMLSVQSIPYNNCQRDRSQASQKESHRGYLIIPFAPHCTIKLKGESILILNDGMAVRTKPTCYSQCLPGNCHCLSVFEIIYVRRRIQDKSLSLLLRFENGHQLYIRISPRK